MKNKPISPSRLDKLLTCSWSYYYSYILGLRNPPTPALSKGSISHLILEMLLTPRHRKHFDLISSHRSIKAAPAIEKLIVKHFNANNLSFDHYDEVCSNILNGLQDFFGDKPDEIFGERDFLEDINGITLRAIVDKIFVYKKKKEIQVTDYKSGMKFSGEKVTSNLQSAINQLVIKKHYPDFNIKFRFLFIKSAKNGMVETPTLSDNQMEGVKSWLEQIQVYLNNFSVKNACEKFPDRIPNHFPCGGRTGDLKKDGNPKFCCDAKEPRFWFFQKDKEGKEINKTTDIRELKEENGEIFHFYYKGCPKFFVENYTEKELSDFGYKD